MNHGERWSAPFNRLLIAFAVVVWAMTLPWWTTLVIAVPVGLVMGSISGHRYGGSQLMLLVAPAFLVATMGLAAVFRETAPTAPRPHAGQLFSDFLRTMVFWITGLVAVAAATLCIRTAWGRMWTSRMSTSEASRRPDDHSERTTSN